MKTDSDNIETYVVVIKPNKQFEIVSDSKNRCYKDVFYTDKNKYYSILTKFDYIIEFNLKKQYQIYQTNSLITKIILDDFPIDEREKYLNRGQLDDFGFLTNKKLENRHNVKLTGLYFNDNKWVTDTKNYGIFPYEYKLNFLIGLTKELYFYSDNAFEIGLRIDGVFYGPFLSKKLQNCFKNYIKFNFDGWNNIINGKQNEYVSDEINIRSINLCKVNNMSVVRIAGSKNLNLYHYVYKMYDMDYCSKIFI